jgi:YD repeat-containing protein
MNQLFTAIIIFFSIPTFAQVNDDVSFYNFSYNKATIKQNKIETVLIDSYSNDKVSSKFSFSFNPEGILIKEIILDGNGKMIGTYNFTCNKYGDLISIFHLDGPSKKKDTTLNYKTYDGTRLIKDSNNLIPVSSSYFYNEKGNVVKTIIRANFGVGNISVRTILNRYDSLNNLVEAIERQYSSEKDTIGRLLSHRLIFYNKFGKPYREEEKINPANNPFTMANKGTVRYTYDEKGNLTEIIRSNAASYKYTYNENGLITSKNMSLVMDEKQTVSSDRYTYIFEK